MGKKRNIENYIIEGEVIGMVYKHVWKNIIIKRALCMGLATILAFFCLSELFIVKTYAADTTETLPTSIDSEQPQDSIEIDERITPIYSAAYNDYFYAGSTYIQVKVWIDAHTGGVTLTANDYCDFDIEGYVEDNWGEKHYFDGSSDNTTYCQAYGGCYISYQQITIVHVKVTASSYDGTAVYEDTIPLTSMS